MPEEKKDDYDEPVSDDESGSTAESEGEVTDIIDYQALYEQERQQRENLEKKLGEQGRELGDLRKYSGFSFGETKDDYGSEEGQDDEFVTKKELTEFARQISNQQAQAQFLYLEYADVKQKNPDLSFNAFMALKERAVQDGFSNTAKYIEYLNMKKILDKSQTGKKEAETIKKTIEGGIRKEGATGGTEPDYDELAKDPKSWGELPDDVRKKKLKEDTDQMFE